MIFEISQMYFRPKMGWDPIRISKFRTQELHNLDRLRKKFWSFKFLDFYEMDQYNGFNEDIKIEVEWFGFELYGSLNPWALNTEI